MPAEGWPSGFSTKTARRPSASAIAPPLHNEFRMTIDKFYLTI